MLLVGPSCESHLMDFLADVHSRFISREVEVVVHLKPGFRPRQGYGGQAGRGLGFGFSGGRGWGANWGAPYAAPAHPYGAPYGGVPTAEQEADMLKGQAEYFKEALDGIKQRIAELEAGTEEKK